MLRDSRLVSLPVNCRLKDIGDNLGPVTACVFIIRSLGGRLEILEYASVGGHFGKLLIRAAGLVHPVNRAVKVSKPKSDLFRVKFYVLCQQRVSLDEECKKVCLPPYPTFVVELAAIYKTERLCELGRQFFLLRELIVVTLQVLFVK